MHPAIRVEKLTKHFRLGGRPKGGLNLTEWLARALRGGRTSTAPEANDFWALRGVSFEVKRGEVVGIIGRNGAGKSTLLKILSRIADPTGGRVELRGRVGSLLEVGTGFHPELTGRENIFLNGSVLGMSRSEITRSFDAIVAFAGVEQFLDTPVKRYSSGMYVRLAFAVAAHLNPEILIIDEVLAVGDAEFQNRCLGKMREVSAGGRTVLFVSHNMTAVQNLCSRAIVLAEGQVVTDGPPAEAVRAYLTQRGDLAAEWTDARAPVANRRVALKAVRVRRADGTVAPALLPDQPFGIEIDYEVTAPASTQIAFRLNRDDGQTVLTTADNDTKRTFCTARRPGRYVARVEFPAHLLAPGRYHLLVAANQVGDRGHDLLESVLDFEVSAIGSLQQIENRLGVVMPLLEWTEERIGD
ncbi:ABC transporter ATP-binding protein [Gemmata sp. G18]|uniref:ABC transporter ATP-binding protein n=1 Tax=Gemmata palustris TaxID=2822762 RepID=A0ABS5C057_9BACT|nr:ABC transporter ATP-binding protein [Gemmata palustris]MBP3959329.1 ABC transporter ATP-binding protein [Gemmata palustris]